MCLQEQGGLSHHSLLRIAKHLQSLANQPPGECQPAVDNIVRWLTMQNESCEELPLDGCAWTSDRQAAYDTTKHVGVVRDAMQRHMASMWASTGPGAGRIHEALQSMLCVAMDGF